MVEVLAEEGSDERHYKRLKELLRGEHGTVRIATAYITERELISGGSRHDVRLLVPDSIVDVARGTISLDALAGLIKTGVSGRFAPRSPKLHAKVYIFGQDTAIVSSANFTCLALHSNIEVGVQISGAQVEKLVAWFDRLWEQGQDITVERLRELRLQTADLRRRYAKLDNESKKIAAAPAPDSAPDGGARGVDALFSTAPRFFVCNTDRKDGERSAGDGFLREEMMAARGVAAAWESFKFPPHMDSVRPGHAIFAFAKGVGVIGVGRAKGPCLRLQPGDRNRLHQGDSVEWQIPVDWLDWRDEAGACPWGYPYNFTFWDISDGKYAQARENVRRHFSLAAY